MATISSARLRQKSNTQIIILSKCLLYGTRGFSSEWRLQKCGEEHRFTSAPARTLFMMKRSRNERRRRRQIRSTRAAWRNKLPGQNKRHGNEEKKCRDAEQEGQAKKRRSRASQGFTRGGNLSGSGDHYARCHGLAAREQSARALFGV